MKPLDVGTDNAGYKKVNRPPGSISGAKGASSNRSAKKNSRGGQRFYGKMDSRSVNEDRNQSAR